MKIKKIDTFIDGIEETQVSVFSDDQQTFIGKVNVGSCDRRGAYISFLFVLKEFRNQGFGRRLVEECIDISAKSGCETIVLSLSKGNESEGFYQKLGFRFAYQYDDGSCLLVKFLK